MQLLVVPKPHHQDRYRNGSGGRRTESRHPAHLAGNGQEPQDVDDHRRWVRGFALRLRSPVSLPHRCRDVHRREAVQVQDGRLAFGGAAQRYGRQALLDQQGHMVDGRGCGTCSRAPVPRIQRYDLLRPDRRPRAWRCLRGRCHRLPAAGHCLPLLVRR